MLVELDSEGSSMYVYSGLARSVLCRQMSIWRWKRPSCQVRGLNGQIKVEVADRYS